MEETKTGAQIIVQSLIDAGVDVVFGFPAARSYRCMTCFTVRPFGIF